MEFIIDNRESTIIKNYFKEKNLNFVSFSNLDIGDYIFKYDDNIILIIERKTIEDFAASINDGRYREQKKRLLSNYTKNKILYIIEGDLMSDNKSIQYNKINKHTIYSSLINLYIRDNINLFISKSIEQTIELFENITKKFEKDPSELIKNYKSDTELFTNSSIKKNNLTPNIIYKRQLCSIPNISENYANIIINYFPNFSKLITELESLSYSDKIDRIKNLSYTKNNKTRKLGNNVAEKLINNIFF